MKSIISTTYDDKYLWFVPLTTWLWNKLNVDVICFMPYKNNGNTFMLVSKVLTEISKGHDNWIYNFDCPEHKEATYAQCSRLYGACLDLPKDEILILGDCDMGLFRLPQYGSEITIHGSDLVPDGQFPMCYASGSVESWRKAFNLYYGALSAMPNAEATLELKTYQQCLDETIGKEECENMRGNLWCRDQESLHNHTKDIAIKIPRAREGTTFAANRLDRDDAYLLERMDDNIIDFHFPRPGYEPQNFEIIMTVLRHYFPLEDFSWLINYNNAYKQLL